MGEFEERQAYEAGRTGQFAPNHETAAYEAGRQGAQYKLKPKKERDTIKTDGAATAILGLFAFFLILLFMVLVLASFAGALISGPVLLLAVKAWGTPVRLSFGEAYQSSAGVLLAALILAAIVFAAGGYFEIQPLLGTGSWFVELLTKPLAALGVDVSGIPDLLRELPMQPLDPAATPPWPWITGFITLVLLAGMACLAKAKSQAAFSGFAGYVRALATVPVILVPGLMLLIVLVNAGKKLIPV